VIGVLRESASEQREGVPLFTTTSNRLKSADRGPGTEKRKHLLYRERGWSSPHLLAPLGEGEKKRGDITHSQVKGEERC